MRLACALVFAILASLAAATASAGEVWVFLNDGRVGWGDPAHEPITLTFGDQSTATVAKNAIQQQATQAEVDAAVDEILSDLMEGKNVKANGLKLQVLGAAAVPKFLACLQSPEVIKRAAGAYGLQFCWSTAAEQPLLAEFKRDKQMRRVAMEAFTRHMYEVNVALCLKEYADGDDLETAGLVFPTVDRYFPDPTLKRIQRLLADEKQRMSAGQRLSQYLSPQLTGSTVPLLGAPDAALQRYAVLGLIAQLADGDAVRTRVGELFKNTRPELREVAAEYFLWLGQESDVRFLQDARSAEKDAYVSAALNSALELIQKRAKQDTETRATLLKQLYDGDAIEPVFLYQTHEHEKKNEYVTRAKLLQKYIGSPAADIQNVNAAAAEVPIANQWTPPLRDYFDPKRRSFGTYVKREISVFAGSVHIGDDCSWSNELRTVVAVAPGVVRLAEHIFSWGHIVIVEHKLPDGSAVCSLYAHLSPALSVKVGDVVKAGQRIGSIGRSMTVDNGGYFAHLHFGIHRGPYSTAGERWISGYIGREKWESANHEWLDPQAFLHGNIDEKK